MTRRSGSGSESVCGGGGEAFRGDKLHKWTGKLGLELGGGGGKFQEITEKIKDAGILLFLIY